MPGTVYHLISRFVASEWFVATDEERSRYLHLLGRALGESDWKCFAYAVMSNHIHLAMVAGDQMLDEWLRRVHTPFADWMNRRHTRIGGVFVRGPRDIPVSPHRWGHLVAYIHNNPVRAGVVSTASASAWTSHRAYVGLTAAPVWLHVAEGLSRSRFTSAEAFDQWVGDPTNDHGRELQLDEELVSAAVSAPGRQQRQRFAMNSIVRAVSDVTGLSVEHLCSPLRSQQEVFVRQAIVVCASRLEIHGNVIAAVLGISRQGARNIVRRANNVCDPRIDDLRQQVLTRLSSVREVCEGGSDPRL